MKNHTFGTPLRKKKASDMCTIDKAYARFGHSLENAASEGAVPASFHDLCRRIGASPADLGEVLENELGMSPYDILDSYFGIGDKNY